METSFPYLFFINGHLDGCQLLAAVNKTAMNLGGKYNFILSFHVLQINTQWESWAIAVFYVIIALVCLFWVFSSLLVVLRVYSWL